MEGRGRDVILCPVQISSYAALPHVKSSDGRPFSYNYLTTYIRGDTKRRKMKEVKEEEKEE